MEKSTASLNILYCREEASSAAWRWLRKLTIDPNFDFKHWHRHQRASRHLSLWSPWKMLKADNFRRLLIPDMLVIGASATLVSSYNTCLATQESMLSLPMECFSVTSVALGLLVTFKTQTCYARFDDARGQWGLIINETRALASRITTRLPSQRGGQEAEVLQFRTEALKLVQTLGHTMKYHLTEDGCNPHIRIHHGMHESEIRSATSTALRAELQQIWDMEDSWEAKMVERIMAPDVGNRPLFVLHELSLLNGRVFSDPLRGGLPPIISADIDRSVTLLHHVLGRCERILRTPVYTPYTKFASRFLYTWCCSIPLAMFPLVGPLLTPPITLAVSFFLFGIQDLGSRVEQPFDVLPLWQYCKTVDDGVGQMLLHSKRFRVTTPHAQGSSFWESDFEDSDEFKEVDTQRLHSVIDSAS